MAASEPASWRVVVVGGGISGLSAAQALLARAREQHLALDCLLVEGSSRLGGKLRSERVGGAGEFLVEHGPDSVLASKPWALALMHALGLDKDLVEINRPPNPVHVLVGGRPLPLPDGMVLGIPTRPLSLARSPLFSARGKLRMGLDLFLPVRRGEEDESVGSFIRRRLGNEALERLAGPLLAGIYNADVERQSLLATFPQLRLLEQEHGSLIRGVLAGGRAAARNARPGPGFVTLRGGLEQLTDALRQQLEGRLLVGKNVAAVSYQSERGRLAYAIHLEDGRDLAADALILALPAYAAAGIVAPVLPELAARLNTIPYVSSAVVNLGYAPPAVAPRLPGYGLIVPPNEGRALNALTISSAKFPDRAPPGHLLLRAFVGGSRSSDVLELGDDELVRLIRVELAELLGLSAEPLFARVSRWERGSPQYEVGHLSRVAEMERLCPPGLHLCGSAYRGIGIPDCVRQGGEAAERVVQELAFGLTER